MLWVRMVSKIPRQLWLSVRTPRATWLDEERVCASRYPRKPEEFEAFAARNVSLLVNLHERPHRTSDLERYGLTELHLPVPDFACPTPAQLDAGVRAINRAVENGQRVVVHCGGGVGRTGTLLACYLVSRGLDAPEALARIRAARPGSVETPQQERAVLEFANRTTRSRPGTT